VMEREQAGKARAAMAFSRSAKAARKRASCAAELRTRKEKPVGGFALKVKGCFQCSADTPVRAEAGAHQDVAFEDQGQLAKLPKGARLPILLESRRLGRVESQQS